MSEDNGAAPKKSLVSKLAEVMGEVERVAKHGRNDFHKYDYATEADILAAVREHMAARNLLLVPTVTGVTWRELPIKDDKKVRDPICSLTVHFRVLDGDSAAELAFDIIGEGQDSGDKATYKAMTGATKYALLKLFLIPTGDDPESDTQELAQGRQETRRRAFSGQPRVGAPEGGGMPAQSPQDTHKEAERLFPTPDDDAERAGFIKDLKRVSDVLNLSAAEKSTFASTYLGKGVTVAKADLPDLAALVDFLRQRAGEKPWAERDRT